MLKPEDSFGCKQAHDRASVGQQRLRDTQHNCFTSPDIQKRTVGHVGPTIPVGYCCSCGTAVPWRCQQMQQTAQGAVIPSDRGAACLICSDDLCRHPATDTYFGPYTLNAQHMYQVAGDLESHPTLVQFTEFSQDREFVEKRMTRDRRLCCHGGPNRCWKANAGTRAKALTCCKS